MYGLILLLNHVNTLVYVLAMDKRLTKMQWLDHGLKTLAFSGAGMLKAGSLAKSLGVTRGSFYWHFADVEDFYRQLLAHWKKQATDSVIEHVEQLSEESDRLQILLENAMADDQKLERAIRSWAVERQETAEVVAIVDKVRLDYIIGILPSPKVGHLEKAFTVKFIYWAYLGRMMMDSGDNDWDRSAIEKVAGLFR